VGIWFGATKAAPNGTYWVVVMPEHSAAHEGFWRLLLDRRLRIPEGIFQTVERTPSSGLSFH
jgi:hypothetical protein